MLLLTGRDGYCKGSGVPLPDVKKAPAGKLSMWMITMPGLTGELLERTGKKLPGVLWHSQMVNLGPPEWAAWQEACRVGLGLPEDWQWTNYLKAVAHFREAGWGKKFGPGSPGGWRRREKKEYVEPDRSNKGLDTSGTLFDSSLSTEHGGDI